MSRAVLALITSALIAIVGVRPIWAQSAATAAAKDLLQSIVARITVHTSTGAGLCHGFVSTVLVDVAYIVTAKHCVDSLSPTTIRQRNANRYSPARSATAPARTAPPAAAGAPGDRASRTASADYPGAFRTADH
jgi:hypothetical protein